MKESVKALLNGVIDYAGLFPPAGLPLGEALENYTRYRLTTTAWMLSRFIAPASRLKDLIPVRQAAAGPIPLSLVVSPGRQKDWEAELEGIQAAARSLEGRFRIDLVELRLPPRFWLSSGWLEPLVREFLEPLGISRCFFEPDPGDDWDTRWAHLLSDLGGFRRSGLRLGVKIRCGGLHPEAFPTSGQLAGVLIEARDRHLPIKATAGLHQPTPHWDSSLGVRHHGFLNLLVAATLAAPGHLSTCEVETILEADASQFRFWNDSLAWRHYQADLEEISQARQLRFCSFGSCSFDEPREGLQILGLLDGELSRTGRG